MSHDSKTFSGFGLQQSILKDIAELSYVHPTPVQAQTIPPALEGKDIIGLAQTGTGKTAAFGLPIIQRVARKMETAALILTPTRELAQQVGDALCKMGKSSDIRVAVIVGGVPIEEDRKALRAWPNVIVATPGRLIDHIYSQSIVLSDVEVLAVDEADRMYDMGFMPQINRIIEVLPQKRQTLMFTATMPGEVEKLVRKHMKSPVRIQIGVTAPAERAEQKLYHVAEADKVQLLLQLLDESNGRVLVFVRTKRKVDRIARHAAKRHRVVRLHGDREQAQREAAMACFRDGRARVLVATDIAARGLDVADIEHVINFDFPLAPEDYIHRIGRTARVAASGLASSFLTGEDAGCLRQLERLIETKYELTRVGNPGPELHMAPKPRKFGADHKRPGRRRRGNRNRGKKSVATAS